MISKNQAVENLSANISYAMQHDGLTVRALAEKLSIPHATIQTLAAGKNEARVSLVANIAEFFHVTVDDLLKRPSEFKKLFRQHAVAG